MPIESPDADSDLLNYYAKDETGRIVRPSEAHTGGEYFCPNCRKRLVFTRDHTRLGYGVRAHFKHEGSNEEACRESANHIWAKDKVKLAVEDWKAGIGECPRVIYKCSKCPDPQSFELPGEIDLVVKEHDLDKETRIDVALMAGTDLKFAVEVFHSNRVSKTKAEKLGSKLLELRASQVVHESHVRWFPINKLYEEYVCARCVSETKQAEQKSSSRPSSTQQTSNQASRLRPLPTQGALPQLQEIRARELIRRFPTGVALRDFKTECQRIVNGFKIPFTLPGGFYRYYPRRCWHQSCGRETLIFVWPGKCLYDKNEPRFEGVKRPLLIKFQEDQDMQQPGPFWMNTCGHCGRPIADWHLHEGSRFLKPFDELLLESETQSFRDDMNELARRWAHDINSRREEYLSEYPQLKSLTNAQVSLTH